jgi:hypothetical protein
MNEEFKQRLLTIYDDLIKGLEEINDSCILTFNEYQVNEKCTENDLLMLSTFARENNRRLQFAKAERELINQS